VKSYAIDQTCPDCDRLDCAWFWCPGKVRMPGLPRSKPRVVIALAPTKTCKKCGGTNFVKRSNKSAARGWSLRCCQCLKNNQRRMYAANRERERARKHQEYAANRETRQAQRRARWAAKTPQERSAANRRWRAARKGPKGARRGVDAGDGRE
jgi:hypothetical protein